MLLEYYFEQKKNFTPFYLCKVFSGKMIKNASLFLAHLSTNCSWWAIVVSGCPSSVVVRRASSVVRRASSVNIWCLHSRDHICDLILMKLDQNVCFNNI